MDRLSDIYAPLFGRILMGGFFLWEGIEKTLNFPATAALVGTKLPEPLYVAVFFIAIEVLGGIALIIGFKTRGSAILLALFTIVASFLYVNFSSEIEISLFLQSMAIVGGLLYISAFGSGSWAEDWSYKRR